MHSDESRNTGSELLKFHFKSDNNCVKSKSYLKELINEKIQNRQRFYGIEILPKSNKIFDFTTLTVQPLFTSIVWLNDDFNSDNDLISTLPAVKCTKQLQDMGLNVLPHLTCYRMTQEQLQQYLNIVVQPQNLLVLRGDQVLPNQQWKYASEMLQMVKELRSDISIGVGGYPDGHPECQTDEENYKNLKIKVDCGADFIITQLCFSATKIKSFVSKCRAIGINIPIIIGIYTPNTYKSLINLINFTQVLIPNDLMEIYTNLQHENIKFLEFSIQNSIEIINDLLNDDNHLNIYGFQLFTLNHFEIIERIINETIHYVCN